MNKEVRVLIKGTHISYGYEENDDEKFENKDEIFIETSGIYNIKDGKHYIRYEEKTEDRTQNSSNMLKINGKEVELIKKGYGATHLYFSEGETNYTYYETVMGKLFVGVSSRQIIIEESRNEIFVKIEYELIMNEEKVSDSVIEMRIISEQE